MPAIRTPQGSTDLVGEKGRICESADHYHAVYMIASCSFESLCSAV